MTITIPANFTQENASFERISGSGAVVDREKGVIRGVKLIGHESLNKRYYSPEVLKKAVPLYENAKVFIDHQESDSTGGRRYKERFGSIKNSRYVEGQGIFGDHHFNPKHATAEQYIWDAENSPDSVGFSHTALLKFASKPDASGRRVVEEVGRVISVDLVAEPATTKGLFESNSHQEAAEMDLKDLTVEQLQSARPDLIKAIEAKSEQEDRLKALESQLADSKKQLETYAAEKKTRETEAAINAELKVAGLDVANKSHVSDVFRKQLIATEDTAARKELISDRAALVKATPAKEGEKLPEKPESHAVEGHQDGSAEFTKEQEDMLLARYTAKADK